MITIYLGDIGIYLSNLCQSVDSNATLITQDNFTNLGPGTYYTSLGDLNNLLNLSSVLMQADKIVYAPPKKWSNSTMKEWSEDYLKVFKFRCQVENFDPGISQHSLEKILNLSDQRKTAQPQLWIAGCSISHGDGVLKQERYGQLLSNLLDIEVSFLSRSGSSIKWAADQISRSDIRSGDIVVWGLTSWNRMPYFDTNNVNHITANSILQNKYHQGLVNPNVLISDNLFYQCLISIYQVINFCKKINATLVIASMLDTAICEYIDYSNLIVLCNLWGRNIEELFIDTGSDGVHPGIKTHQFYADQIYQKIQQVLATEQ
jgi:hypothetical protein